MAVACGGMCLQEGTGQLVSLPSGQPTPAPIRHESWARVGLEMRERPAPAMALDEIHAEEAQ